MLIQLNFVNQFARLSSQVKGLLPDEEKEKIGPKNVVTPASRASATKPSQSGVISAKPQANPNPVVSHFKSSALLMIFTVFFSIKACEATCECSPVDCTLSADSTADVGTPTSHYDDARSSHAPDETSSTDE